MRDTKGKTVGKRPDLNKYDQHAAHLDSCPDCLKTVATHMGVHHKPDDFKSEDPGGKTGTVKAGHVTERARH